MSGTDECVKQSMKMRERRRKIKDYNATLHVEQHIKKVSTNFSCNFLCWRIFPFKWFFTFPSDCQFRYLGNLWRLDKKSAAKALDLSDFDFFLIAILLSFILE